jgi:hypothetical protein
MNLTECMSAPVVYARISLYGRPNHSLSMNKILVGQMCIIARTYAASHSHLRIISICPDVQLRVNGENNVDKLMCASMSLQ